MAEGIHHVALRCANAQQTVDFYCELLDAKLVAAVAGDTVPSTGEFSPHINLFLALENGAMLDFIEVPLSPPAQKDPNTPAWVQHLALSVSTREALIDTKQRLTSGGVDVIGPIDHGFCQSIYFFDPSGHRVELAWNNAPEKLAAMGQSASGVLRRWNEKKSVGWR